VSSSRDVPDVPGVGDVADVLMSLRGICRRFPSPTGDVDALVDVDVDVRRAAMTVLSGPSGSGKSTLLMLMAAADRPDAGDIEIVGLSLLRLSRRRRREWRRDRLGLVLPQPWDNLTVAHDTVGNVMWAYALRHRGNRLASTDATDALGRVGLGDRASASISNLSTGEQMRLAFACALVGDPVLVVADEPTASLDAGAAAGVISLMSHLASTGTTLVVATHDHAVIDAAHDVVALDHGTRVS
jgi:putative ABC transport system ATP-binding protein